MKEAAGVWLLGSPSGVRTCQKKNHFRTVGTKTLLSCQCASDAFVAVAVQKSAADAESASASVVAGVEFLVLFWCRAWDLFPEHQSYSLTQIADAP